MRKKSGRFAAGADTSWYSRMTFNFPCPKGAPILKLVQRRKFPQKVAGGEASSYTACSYTGSGVREFPNLDYMAVLIKLTHV